MGRLRQAAGGLARLADSYGRGRNFWWDFLPFVAVLVTYDSFSNLIPQLNHRVHYDPALGFDRWLGQGTLPSVWLQHHLLGPGLAWYDLAFLAVYLLHFICMVALALVIWKYRIQWFRRFMGAFLVVTYGAFLFFLAYPTAPPWLAARQGLVHGLMPVLDRILDSLSASLPLARLYRGSEPNPVAALPSLHAAYPTLIWLFARRIWGWRLGLYLAWYPIGVWLAVVYMGEHYVADVLAGIGLALVGYWLGLRIDKQA